jgi:hypothetical protein
MYMWLQEWDLAFTLWPTASGHWGYPVPALNHLLVLHRGVAQKNVDSKPIVRPDVSSSTQGMQALGEEGGVNMSSTQETSPLAPEGHQARF